MSDPNLPPFKGLSNTDNAIVITYAVFGTLWWLLRGCPKP